MFLSWRNKTDIKLRVPRLATALSSSQALDAGFDVCLQKAWRTIVSLCKRANKSPGLTSSRTIDSSTESMIVRDAEASGSLLGQIW